MGSNFADEIDCANLFENIDDLIDFPSDNDCCNGFVGSGDYNDFPSIWNEALPDTVNIFSGTSSNAASDLSADLSLPNGDIPQFEWFSTFEEESFSGGAGINLGNDNLRSKEKSHNYQFQTSSPVSVLESSSTSSSSSSCSGEKVIPRGTQRARSKRPRPATFNPRPAIHLISPTSPGTLHPFVGFGIPSESENLAESGGPILELPKLEAMTTTMTMEEVPKKKKKKVKLPATAIPLGASPMDNINQNATTTQAVRKCLHCEITKTPQWRAGPMGPKTLCNACGVRYKSGRLFPEYRPAASPTFVPNLHSNSHKKVIEMRSKDVYKPLSLPSAPAAESSHRGIVADTKPSSSAVEYI